jgi:hypothetical protein
VLRRLALAPVLVLAVAAPAPAARDAETLVIKLKSVTISSRVDDRAPKGPSRGDVMRGRSRLLNDVAQLGSKAGAAVGGDTFTITLSSPTAGAVDAVVSLPGGTLRVKGAGSLTGATRFPVIGGTGRFAGARGTCAVAGSGDATLNTYRVTLPDRI